MGSIVKVEFHFAWAVPVMVLQNGCRNWPIRGPRQALIFLENEMPCGTLPSYDLAADACARALLHHLDLAIARACFLLAYQEYEGLFARPRQSAGSKGEIGGFPQSAYDI